MIVLDNGDKIRGDASAATVVDYTLHGVVASTLTQLADGQLASSIGDLYTAGAIVVVTTIILVNTDTSARTVNLYLTPSGGTARRIIPKDTSLGIGYSLHFDGAKVNIVNPTGGIVTSYETHASNHQNGGTDEIDVAGLSGLLADDQHVLDTEVVSAVKADAGLPVVTITFVIDGGGSAITTGVKGALEIPFACTINRVTLLADQSGSIVVDIWKQAYADYPPEDANSITASAPPTLSSAVMSQDSTLTGWTTAITAGDCLKFNVDSITTCTRMTISLKVTKT